MSRSPSLLARFRLRPSFYDRVELPLDEFTKKIQEQFEHVTPKQTALFFGNYVELHIPKEELRFWSPHLSLHFDQQDSTTTIFGRFAPRQEVWTFIWIVYMALAFSAFFAAMYAYSEWILGTFHWVTFLAPLCLIGIALIHLAGCVGQSWSSDQIQTLQTKYEQIMANIRNSPTAKD